MGMPSWYAENGQYLTTQFFGMKANRYLHDHGISQATLAKVAAKNFRNGALNPNAFRRKPIPEDQILNSTMLKYPLTQYMFCAPDEGAAAAVAEGRLGAGLDGAAEARLIALACSPPPEGRACWTMQLLADELVELRVVGCVSDETVRRTLKKTRSSPGRASSGASRRRPAASS